MPEWFISLLPSIGTLLISLSVTLAFNKIVGIPQYIKKQKDADKKREDQLKKENDERDAKIAILENAMQELPKYRNQSLQVQTQLKSADDSILDLCIEIKNSVLNSHKQLSDRLDRLERREKNSIRAKLLDEYRLFTDSTKNPMLAWSEMEYHAFFELVRDYEDLKGNDYVHSTVLPAMHELAVIPMSDKQALLALMSSRKL